MRSFTRQLTINPTTLFATKPVSTWPGRKVIFSSDMRMRTSLECRAFLEAIEVGREFPVSVVDGLRALVWAAAADRSAHAGQPVPIKGIEVTSRKTLPKKARITPLNCSGLCSGAKWLTPRRRINFAPGMLAARYSACSSLMNSSCLLCTMTMGTWISASGTVF